jgi:hypothetical protein
LISGHRFRRVQCLLLTDCVEEVGELIVRDGSETRGVTGVRVASDFGETTTIDAMRAVHASSDTQLEIVGAHTGAKLLDVFPDVCGRNNKVCSPLFDEGEPKFSDGAHLHPIFVQDHLHFLDFLLTYLHHLIFPSIGPGCAVTLRHVALNLTRLPTR